VLYVTVQYGVEDSNTAILRNVTASLAFYFILFYFFYSILFYSILFFSFLFFSFLFFSFLLISFLSFFFRFLTSFPCFSFSDYCSLPIVSSVLYMISIKLPLLSTLLLSSLVLSLFSSLLLSSPLFSSLLVYYLSTLSLCYLSLSSQFPFAISILLSYLNSLCFSPIRRNRNDRIATGHTAI
jgi:hypothetical protein